MKHVKSYLRKLPAAKTVIDLIVTSRHLTKLLSHRLEFNTFLRNIESQRYPKYIITSKDVYAGTNGNDYPDPLKITEIATELIITRLYLLDLLNSGVITNEVTIVCIEDRKALYTEIFSNVLSFQEFNLMKISKKKIIDLLGNRIMNNLASGPVSERLIPYLPFYRNWERDKELILSFTRSSLDYCNLDRPFVSLVIRKRGAWPEKNMDDEFWKELLVLLSLAKIPVFVFGKETEEFSLLPGVTYVRSFQDWCTLVAHPNSAHIGSTMTGGVYPALIFGNSNCKMTLIDNQGLMSIHGNDPSFYHSCINFAEIEIRFLEYIPTPREYFDAITQGL